MKYLSIFACAALLLGASAQAESADSNSRAWGPRLYAGYLAYQFRDPGFQLGVEATLAEARRFSALAALSLHAYTQTGIQTGVSLNLRYGLRGTTRSGFFFDELVGLGYEHVFYTQTSYDIQGTNATRIDSNLSAPACTPQVVFGLGYDFRSKTSLPLLLYLRASLSWRIPDRNLLFQNSFMLEAGAMVALKGKGG